MTIKRIIFDYDGVIADSFPLRYEVFKHICATLNKPCPATMEELQSKWGDNAVETMLVMGFTPDEIVRGRELFKNALDTVTPPFFPGISLVLHALAQQYTLSVLTANKQSLIREQLEDEKISQYFDIIIGNDTLFAENYSATKEAKIIAFLKQTKCTPQQVLFIADRDIDRRDALLAGIPEDHIILTDYGWGHTKKQHIKINEPEHLLQAIEYIAGRANKHN